VKSPRKIALRMDNTRSRGLIGKLNFPAAYNALVMQPFSRGQPEFFTKVNYSRFCLDQYRFG
jgi:hypothetical protein